MSNEHRQYTNVMNEENSTPTPPSPTPTESKRQSTLKSILREVFIFAVIAFGIVLPFRMYVAEPYVVSGASMDPTFTTGDYLIVDKLSYKLGEPKRNTVIVFRYPNDPTKNFIKSIIGLPGDTVTEVGNTIRITNPENPRGFEIDQSYVTHPLSGSFQKTLGKDEYFVLGDNRAESFDSRYWGVLRGEYILGKPILRLWPLGELGISPGQDDK